MGIGKDDHLDREEGRGREGLDRWTDPDRGIDGWMMDGWRVGGCYDAG